MKGTCYTSKSGRDFEILCILREIGYKKHIFRFVAFFSLLVIFFSLETFRSIHSIPINDVLMVRGEMHTFFMMKCYIVTQQFDFQVLFELQPLYIIILSPFCINMFNKRGLGHSLIHFDSNQTFYASNATNVTHYVQVNYSNQYIFGNTHGLTFNLAC